MARRPRAAALAAALGTVLAAALAGLPPSPAAAGPLPKSPAAAGALPKSPAAAGAEYRYWSYWQAGAGSGGEWTYASVGPGGAVPRDGDVEGWRFLVSADGEGTPPRGTSDFAALCRDTPEREGRKRVGVVLDYGTTTDAPEGSAPPQPREACASVPEDATGADVVAAVAEPRFGRDGYLCALDGYPEAGCGDPVDGDGAAAGGDGNGDAGSSDDAAADGAGEARAADGSGDGGPPVGLLVGAGLVALLGGGALWRAREARTR